MRVVVYASGAVTKFFQLLLVVTSAISICGFFLVGNRTMKSVADVLHKCIYILVGLGSIQFLLNQIHKSFEFGQLKRCRNELLVGFGITFLMAIFPRVFIVQDGDHREFIATFCPILSAVTAFASYYLFIHRMENFCYWRRRLSYTAFGLMFFFNVFQLEDIFGYHQKLNEGQTTLINLTCGLIAAGSCIGLYDVLRGALVLKADVTHIQQTGYSIPMVSAVLTVRIGPDVIKTVEGLECRICLHQYSIRRLPKVLTGCGHSICQQCGETLLIRNECRPIACPACRMETPIANDRSIPTNYDMLHYIEERGVEVVVAN